MYVIDLARIYIWWIAHNKDLMFMSEIASGQNTGQHHHSNSFWFFLLGFLYCGADQALARLFTLTDYVRMNV